ncbi:hypothetical protein [Aureispira sp. CCB-QB1]|uniref:hypothetical protein n=1 Tax=Aureispira sp. CCB-QB1 TaxID=1313421 RepID=UPI00069715C7|nr:hypothetical protein [Aureispira sp. CCB-QB1]
MRIIKKIVLVLILSSISNLSNARGISVDFIKLLAESSKIIRIKVISIENQVLKYINLNSQKIGSASTLGTQPNTNKEYSLSGYLPRLGDTVVIVINNLNEVCLYAKKINSNYKFWSPLVSTSRTLFFYPRPVKVISLGHEERWRIIKKKQYFYSLDSCILESKYFERGKKFFRKKWFKKLYKQR